jgi:hypothetical protein
MARQILDNMKKSWIAAEKAQAKERKEAETAQAKTLKEELKVKQGMSKKTVQVVCMHECALAANLVVLPWICET